MPGGYSMSTLTSREIQCRVLPGKFPCHCLGYNLGSKIYPKQIMTAVKNFFFRHRTPVYHENDLSSRSPVEWTLTFLAENGSLICLLERCCWTPDSEQDTREMAKQNLRSRVVPQLLVRTIFDTPAFRAEASTFNVPFFAVFRGFNKMPSKREYIRTWRVSCGEAFPAKGEAVWMMNLTSVTIKC